MNASSRRSRRSENVRNGTISERDSVIRAPRLHAALLRGCACRGAQILRQAREIPLVLQHQPVARFVGEHVLGESRRQRGEALDDRGAPRLGRVGEPRAGTLEIEVHALQQPQLLRVEAELVPAAMQVVDTREERRVQVDRAVVRREPRRHLALDGLQVRRRLGRGEVVEHSFDAGQRTSASIERGERVLERGWLLQAGDRGDFGAMRSQRLVERGDEVLGSNRRERRQPEGRGPRLEQRIVGDGSHDDGTGNGGKGRRASRPLECEAVILPHLPAGGTALKRVWRKAPHTAGHVPPERALRYDASSIPLPRRYAMIESAAASDDIVVVSIRISAASGAS